MKKSPVKIHDILGAEGLLAESLQDFEYRSSQMDMALLIQNSLEKEMSAVVEAGTGTGKTFGYLVPIILSGKKAVISTGTKNLQEQIFFKDLPVLKRVMPFNIDAVIMKGRKNYLCLHRYHQYFSQASFIKGRNSGVRHKLEKWLRKTEFADCSELPWLSDRDDLWDALSSTSEQCLGSDCMFLDECYLGRLRSRAVRSRIIIVNHYLFFADAMVKMGGFGEIIPRFQVVVFDEAHRIEEIATSYFGESISTNQLVSLANDLEKEIKGWPGRQDENSRLVKDSISLRNASEQLRTLFSNTENRGRLDEETLASIRQGPAEEIRRLLRNVHLKEGAADHDKNTLQALANRAVELDSLLEHILVKNEDNWLKWYDKQVRSLTLHASPLDISERMNEFVFEKVKTVILTSATLSTNGNFDYIRSCLGLRDEAMEGIFRSHFDFEKQSLMYIPKDIPGPNDHGFGAGVAERIMDILKRTDGRALVLFTSYSNMNLVYDTIKEKIPYAIYRQGDAPRSILLDEFRKNINSVLLATGSFWQGVDVPGEALSCLIIDRLPFDSPGDPLVSARIDVIREKGGNPFMDYQVPSAIISLKQGLGRLIRTSTDRGIIAIMDTRIMTSRYGSLFIKSMPGIPITHDLAKIDHFFTNEI
ncbi:MAG: ATP-dependent DNA helicase [Deltaproteobacteria bacterium]|nr:ATP-dependent DNA helicase [Deltaproteobacteria bacterium]